MKSLILVLVALHLSIGCSAHNILVFLPLSIWSHYMQVEPIFHALAQRGHNVTVISPFPPKKEEFKFKHVALVAERWKYVISDVWNPMEFTLRSQHAIFEIPSWKALADSLVPEVINSTVFQDLLQGNNRFDLIFAELFFGQEAFVVLGHLFDAPIVSYSSYGHNPSILKVAGAANAFSYLSVKDLSYAGRMSLGQRLDNALTHIVNMLYNEWWYYPCHDALLHELIPGTYPRISDMLKNISLIFLTANTAVDGTKLYPPHVIELSGIHLTEPKQLDQNLKKIMDNAEKGVIYFSLGSMVNTSNFREEDIHAYLSVFRKLDQSVLWKTDLNASQFKIPANVHLRSWFHQTSVLAHPNCVLFLTHGGLSSMMEAIKHAVPVIGMPFYGDQIINTANAEYYGYGLRLLYSNLTQQSLNWAIKTVLGDPRFKENMNRASKIFSDKPMSSLDTAVYWTEYVIRHRGAHHLKTLAAQLPWYQLFLLDVIFLFSTALITLFYLTSKLVLILPRIFSRKPNSLKEKKH